MSAPNSEFSEKRVHRARQGRDHGGLGRARLRGEPAAAALLGDGARFTWESDDTSRDKAQVLETLRSRPAGVHVVITGRDVPEALLELADLVTEMKLVKHPFQRGEKAGLGVDF